MAMLSAGEAAIRVGVDVETVLRFCRQRPDVAIRRTRGHPYDLTPVDLMALRVRAAVNGIGRNVGTRRPITTDLLAAAETAIRSRPRRWLLLTNRNGQITATTHDTAEACGPAWLSRGGVAWLIDLIPEVS